MGYLGVADDSAVKRLFQSEAAFIAPIGNSFGAKFKVAEAISYGIPLLATENAMSGVPFLPWLRRIQLENPRDAAAATHFLIENGNAQREMSAGILRAAADFIREQNGVWGRQLALLGSSTD